MVQLILLLHVYKSAGLKYGVIRADGYTEFRQQAKLCVTHVHKT